MGAWEARGREPHRHKANTESIKRLKPAKITTPWSRRTSQKGTGYEENDVAESRKKHEEKETRIRRMTR